MHIKAHEQEYTTSLEEVRHAQSITVSVTYLIVIFTLASVESGFAKNNLTLLLSSVVLIIDAMHTGEGRLGSAWMGPNVVPLSLDTLIPRSCHLQR